MCFTFLQQLLSHLLMHTVEIKSMNMLSNNLNMLSEIIDSHISLLLEFTRFKDRVECELALSRFK